jgi:hypothetical protein
LRRRERVRGEREQKRDIGKEGEREKARKREKDRGGERERLRRPLYFNYCP